MSIKNLYMRCLQTMHGKFKPLSEDDMSPADYMCEALGEVCDRVLDLKDVVSGYMASTVSPFWKRWCSSAPSSGMSTMASAGSVKRYLPQVLR